MVAKLCGGARFRMGEPIPREVAIRSDRPWDGHSFAVNGMFEWKGTYYLYYRTQAEPGPSSEEKETVGLALSKDGIHWEKPNLGLVSLNGKKDNNLLPGPDGGVFYLDRDCFFLDPRPETPAEERFKVFTCPNLYKAWRKEDILRPEIWVSGDGIRFRRSSIQVNLTSKLVNAFDGVLVFWSPAEKLFVGFFRWGEAVPVSRLSPSLSAAADIVQGDFQPEYPDPREEKRILRSACVATSPDLSHWGPLHPMSYGDTPREHIYETGAFPYFRAPDQYIGLANRLFIGRRALSAGELAGLKILPTTTATGRMYYYDNDINDLVLLSTRPGSTTFHRQFMEAFVRPGRNPGNWTSRDNYSGSWVYQTGPDEMSFLVTRQHRQEGNHLQRFSLRLDGFASINAPYSGGEMVTAPLIFSGDRLELNYATSAAGQIQVEIENAAGDPLPGYSLAESAVLIGDRISGEARWRSGPAVASLAGRPIRLRFVLRDADLYSYRFH